MREWILTGMSGRAGAAEECGSPGKRLYPGAGQTPEVGRKAPEEQPSMICWKWCAPWCGVAWLADLHQVAEGWAPATGWNSPSSHSE